MPIYANDRLRLDERPSAGVRARLRNRGPCLGHLHTAQLLSEALDYAAKGFAVYPVQPRGKKPLTSHGFKDASVGTDQIRNWWSQWPDANIGLPATAEYVVLDVDSDRAIGPPPAR